MGDKRTISEAVRDAAKVSGQTQVELAAGAGVSQRGISEFLAGGGLQSKSLDALARHLGVTVKVPKKLRGKRESR